MAIPIGCIVLGTVMIGAGGIIAAKGWVDLGSANRRKGLVKAVAAEWMMNMNIYRDPVFAEQDPQELAKFVHLPRMQTTAIDGLMASGLFTGEQDRKFFTHVTRLREALSDFNARVEFTQTYMAQTPGAIVPCRQGIRDGRIRKNVGKWLKEFGELLVNECGIGRDERFYDALDD